MRLVGSVGTRPSVVWITSSGQIRQARADAATGDEDDGRRTKGNIISAGELCRADMNKTFPHITIIGDGYFYSEGKE